MWRQAVEYRLVIVVQPVYLLLRQLFADDRTLVDGTERQRLKLQELAEFRLFVKHNQQSILDTGTTAAGQVDAGFVGDGHAFHQRGRLPLHAKLMRTFVNIQVSTHAVSRAVQVVQPVAPHRLTGQDINLRTTGTAGELA